MSEPLCPRRSESEESFAVGKRRATLGPGAVAWSNDTDWRSYRGSSVKWKREMPGRMRAERIRVERL